MRVSVPPEESYHLINHGCCPLLTTAAGPRRNVAPINWTMPLNSDPPLVLTVVENGIYTDELIRASEEFVVNVMGESMAARVLACGRIGGRDADKFAKAQLTPLASKTVHAPFLSESVAHIECRLVGSHPHEGVTIFVGRVEHAEVRSEFWDGKRLLAEKAKTIHHLGAGVFAVTDRVIAVSKPA